MDLINGLHTFIRVVETGSFSAVAREANASQSAVTRQVAQLEEHFGVRLFHRTTRKLSLTDEGQDLVSRARHLLEEAEDLEDTFGKNGGAPTGLVRIGMPVGAAILLVPDFTALLRQVSRPGGGNGGQRADRGSGGGTAGSGAAVRPVGGYLAGVAGARDDWVRAGGGAGVSGTLRRAGASVRPGEPYLHHSRHRAGQHALGCSPARTVRSM